MKKIFLFIALTLSLGSVTFLNSMKQNKTPYEKASAPELPELNFMQPVSYNSNLQEEKFQPNLEEDERLEETSEVQRLKEEMQFLKKEIKNLKTKKKKNAKKTKKTISQRLEKLRKLKKDNDAKGIKKGWTLLHYAAKFGYVGVMKRLGNKHMNAKTYGRKNTPLHIAVWNNQPEAVKLLLAWDANYNATNHEYSTPLHLATRLGYTDIMEILCKNKANVNKVDSRNFQNSKPLNYALDTDNTKAKEILKKYNAKSINAIDRNGKIILLSFGLILVVGVPVIGLLGKAMGA